MLIGNLKENYRLGLIVVVLAIISISYDNTLLSKQLRFGNRAIITDQNYKIERPTKYALKFV